jgi:hypothetical protein
MPYKGSSLLTSLMRSEGGFAKLIPGLLITFVVHWGYSALPIGTNFAGIAQTAYTPPDPSIAVGPSHIVAAVNSTFTIYTKTGNSSYSSSLANWFAPANPPGTPFQPKLVYDANGGHWIMLALASGNPRRSSYLISVSSNSNPIGVWWLWNIDAGLDQSTASGNTADSPGLGYDDEAIYITSNQYDSHDDFQYAKVRIIPKSQLYTGSGVTWRDFWNQTNANGLTVFGWKPAQAQSALNGNYLIDTRPNGSNYVTLWKVTNPVSTNPGPTLTRQATLSVQSYSAPNDAAQSGGNAVMNTGDCRAQEVQFQQGKLVTAFTEGYDWGGGAVSAIRTLVLDPANNSVNVDNRFGSNAFWFYYPAIVRDSAGNMAMVCNRSGSNEYAGVGYTVWPAGETNWQTSSTLKAGQAYYGSGINLWGSYSGAALDPTNAGHAWLCGEYSVSSSQWGTWIGEIAFPGNSNDVCGSAISLTNGVSYATSTSGATSTNDPTTVCSSGVGKGVWFSFSPNATGPVLISTCGSDYSTVLQVYGGSCGALTHVDCNAGNGIACSTAQASLRFNGTGGTIYRIFVGGAGGASGNLSITAYSPANEQCEGALELTNALPYSMNTASAGATGDPTPACAAAVTKSVWFSFVPTLNGLAQITTCGSDFDTVLQVYSGSCSSLSSVTCNDNNGPLCAGSQASVSFHANAGTRYWIQAGGSAGSSGNLVIKASSVGNDICAGALPLPPGASHFMNTSTASSEGDPSQVCGWSVGKGVWFSFTAPGDGEATISTCGSTYDTVLQIYSGSCGFLTPIDCSNGSAECFGSEASIEFDAFAGTPYLIFVAGVSGASGNLFISNSFCQPPQIVGGSTNTFLTPTGILVSATVVLAGTPPFSVTWSMGPLVTNTGPIQSFSFLIPLDQIPDFMTETNFATINVIASNDCGSDGGDGGFSSPCIICLSRGVPVTSTTTASISGTGPNLASGCGNVGFSAKWFDMAAANSGAADVSVFQDTGTNCFVSVFAGTLPNLAAVICNKTITNRQTRVQFDVSPTEHYYLVVSNSATITNMTFGFIPQISVVHSSGQFQLKSGVGPALPYTFQATPEIGGAWSNFFSAVFPTNGITVSDLSATNFNERFYRLVPGLGP